MTNTYTNIFKSKNYHISHNQHNEPVRREKEVTAISMTETEDGTV